MIAPAAPPTAAPMIAPRAVEPVCLPTTPPTTAPLAAPMVDASGPFAVAKQDFVVITSLQRNGRHHFPRSIMRIRSLLASAVAAVALAACHRPNADEHISHMSGGDVAAPNAAAAGRGNPALPPSNNAAKARLAASPRHG